MMGALVFATLLIVLGGRTDQEASSEVGDPPPALSATAEPIDRRVIDTTSAWAAGAGIPDGGSIRDLISGEGSLVAVGSVGSRAAVWGSINGDRWTAASVVEAPAESVSRILVAAEWGGEWIAFGTIDGDPAVWRAQNWRTWELTATPNELSGFYQIIDIVGAADGFWLVASKDGRQALWNSSDGPTWTEHMWGFGDEVVITAATAGLGGGEWLYLAGSRCRDSVCRPAVWRTQDGMPMIGATSSTGGAAGELGAASGELVAISASATRVVAAGFAQSGQSELPELWESTDGVNWYPISDRASLPPTSVTLRVQNVSDTDPARASLLLSGRAIEVAAGDMVITDAGELAVESIESRRVVVTFGGDTHDLAIGSVAELEVERRIEHVAVDAGRIIASGFESDGTGSKPARLTWISVDGGRSWEVHRLPDTPSRLLIPGIRRQRMVVVAASGSSWVHDWDTTSAAADAVGVFTRFVGAIGRGNLAGVIGSLPESRPGDSGPMELPGLIQMQWWSPDGGLDLIAIAGALEFLATLDSTIALTECEGTHQWDGTGRVRVDCRYRLGSDFVAAMGLTELPGRISAMVGDGAVTSVVAPDATAQWQALDHWIRESDPTAAEAIFGSGEPGSVAPPPDASLAEAVLATARSFRSGFLQPGDAIETATPAGTIVWTLHDPFDQRPPFWIEAVGGAFWAMTADDSGNWDSGARLWRSEDGIRWGVVGGGPPGFWGEPMVFDDRLVVTSQSGSGQPLLSEWDGERWANIAIDSFPDDGEWWLNSVAESNGRVLLVADGWDASEERPLGSVVWALTPAGRFERVALAGPDLSADGFARLTGWNSGFALLWQTDDTPGGPAGEVWISADGLNWELAASELPLRGYVEWFGPIGGGLGARGYAGDECEQVAGDSRCYPVGESWRSADGVRWERAPVGDLKGYFELESGPLGTIAVSQGGVWRGPRPLSAEPVTVLMASQEGPFEEVAGLRVGVPFAEFYWTGGIEMSADAVVVSVTGVFLDFGEWGRTEQHWLLVGSLVAP